MDVWSESNPNGMKEIGSRVVQHIIENIIEDDYVRFGPLNNWCPSAWFELINVPVRIIYGADDFFCVRAD